MPESYVEQLQAEVERLKEENERLKLDAKRARLDLEEDRESSEWMADTLHKTDTALELLQDQHKALLAEVEKLKEQLQENNDRLRVELEAARRVIERVLVWREATSEDEQIGASDELDKALADYERIRDSDIPRKDDGS